MAEMDTELLELEQPTEEEWIEGASNSLQALFEQEPGSMQAIERVMAEHLRGAVTVETGQVLLTSLGLLIGQENADFLLTLTANGMDDPDLLAQTEQHLDGPARTFVRSLLALYGNAVREAYRIGGENPNGWRAVNRQVFYDLMSNRWQINFEIVKRNGERTTYEEEPTSLLVLADAILDTLTNVPPELATDILDPASLKSLANTYDIFMSLYIPYLSAEPGDMEGAGERGEEMVP